MENKLETEKICSKCKFYGEPCLKTGAPTKPCMYGCKFWKEPAEPHLSKENALVQVMFYKDLHYHADQLDIVVGDLSNGAEASDNRLIGSLELARLILLYYEKCAFDDDNYSEVFKKLRSLDGDGMFTEEDLERFYIKK